MIKLTLGALLFVAPVVTMADSLRPSLNEVSSYLADNSVPPITQQADMQLSRNILNAQGALGCTYCGPESRELSIQSVLRAISLYCCWDGSPTIISSEALESLWCGHNLALLSRHIAQTEGSGVLELTLAAANWCLGHHLLATKFPITRRIGH